MSKTYDDDFYGWTQEQGEALRRRSANELDWDNLGEEIESLGREQAAKLRSSLRLIALHLLKWIAQPSKRSKSWRATIVRERSNVADCLRDNPRLAPRVAELFEEAYPAARREAVAETGLAIAKFPATPAFSLEEACDHDFWPQ